MALPTHRPHGFLARAEFVPALAALDDSAPSPLPGAILWTLLALLGALVVWAVVGRLDVIAAAEGRLVPRSQLKIVQPAEGGVLRELLVAEGERVRTGQILGRMDTLAAQADETTLQAEFSLRLLQLRRIDADVRPLAAQHARVRREDEHQAPLVRDASPGQGGEGGAGRTRDGRGGRGGYVVIYSNPWRECGQRA